MDVADEEAIKAGIAAGALAFGGLDLVVNNAGLSKSAALEETTAQLWDLQHNVMPRGSFLVSREAAQVMRRQGLGGDIVYIASKNAIAAGPKNIAYSSAKASQAHQVRLLAAELGEDGIRVNGINPDGVVRGSGIFSGGWGADRAKVYGVRRSSSVSTTPSAPCSSGRSSQSTSPRRCWPSPAGHWRSPPGCWSQSTAACRWASCAEVKGRRT
jgi:NAD(P)-dependent dehydrogenase (short-subunit alcohol dehydrogenase family)